MGRVLAENERKNVMIPKTSALPSVHHVPGSKQNENKETSDNIFKEAVGENCYFFIKYSLT